MTLKVCIKPTLTSIEPSNGIGRVVYAQNKHLPSYGIELVNDPREADVYAPHTQGFGYDNISVLTLHGMYWLGDLNSGSYGQYNLQANNAIIEAARRAYAITVPSAWVAMPFKRDMRIDPVVIGHGIEFSEWEVGTPQGYALWGKNRTIDVCKPDAPHELAKRGVPIMSTYALPGEQIPQAMQIIGAQDQEAMKQIISGADVYLATVKETFGIQTLEAMACGVPVIGWNYGGTADIVTSGYDGILVNPGDYDALYEAYREALQHRDELGRHARETASRYDWHEVIGQYAALYERVADELRHERRGVSVVITNYNYGRYVDRAVESVLRQTQKPDEIIVVDDGSTDNSLDQLARFNGQIKVITQENQGVAAARTVGIEAATQANIVLLDADDRIDTNFIQTLHKPMLADRGLGIAYTGLLAVDDAGHIIGTDFPPEFDWEKQASATNPPACCVPSCCMFKREMWRRAGPHKQEYAPGEDAEFWTRGLSVGFTARKVTTDKLFIYSVHENSATRKLRYRPIDDRLPWMRDKRYPLAAPSNFAPLVKSYSEPKVSVIVSVTRETVDHLPNLIDSLLGQTMREWELITNFYAIKERYPFALFAVDRDVALNMANAAYVLFLNADDMLTNSALEDMLIAFIQSGGRYVYADTLNIKGVVTPQPDYHQVQPAHQSAALVPTDWAREVGAWSSWQEFYTVLAIKGHCGQHLGRALIIREDTSEVLNAADWQRLRKYEGAEIMSCCGNNGDAIMEAKNALAGMMAAPLEPGRVRLEYIGTNAGAISFFGSNGAEYRGGNNDLERYADVFESDVNHLVNTGKWQRALAIAPAEPGPMVESQTPAPIVIAQTQTPIPELAAASVPDVIEVTAEDEEINKVIAETRKRGRPRKS
jgi:glycosyltransferase involved in cell wall biosynthesis